MVCCSVERTFGGRDERGKSNVDTFMSLYVSFNLVPDRTYSIGDVVVQHEKQEYDVLIWQMKSIYYWGVRVVSSNVNVGVVV